MASLYSFFIYSRYQPILSVHVALFHSQFSLELFTSVIMLTCFLSVLWRCVSAVCGCINVCVNVMARRSSPHPILGCNLCHRLEFDGWAAPHNTMSPRWSGCVYGCINVYVLGKSVFQCNSMSLSDSIQRCGRVNLLQCVRLHLCVHLREWTVLFLHCLRWNSVTVRSPEETAEARDAHSCHLSH